MKIKVISLNIWHSHMLPASLAFLKAQNADIVLAQEVSNSSDLALAENYRAAEYLRAELALPYIDFAPTALFQYDPAKVDEGLLILSRFPISHSTSHFFYGAYREVNPFDSSEWPKIPRALQHATIEVEGTELNVFNLQGVWDLDGDNYSEDRRKMSETIVSNTVGVPNLILAGDTNAKPTNPAMKSLEAHLKPVFGDELKSTFNMRRKSNPGYATAAVDLMYVSPTIAVLSKSCPDVDVSDHLPLAVELDVPAGAPR
jgi:endonuclease/exonuclease/phosphatase family metal-dependent hydrolase